MSILRTSLGLIALGGFGACGVLDESVAVQQGGTYCPLWACGNSPLVDHMGMHDLNVRGVPNDNGFYLEEVDHFGKKAELTVYGAQANVRLLETGAYVSTIGTTLIVKNINVSGTEYHIKFLAADEAPLVARGPGGAIVQTPTYEVAWSAVTGSGQTDYENICDKPPSPNDPDVLGGMNPIHLVVFEEDRFDGERLIAYDQQSDWINFGCAGHALAKLHFTGHSTGANHLESFFETKLDDKTAMLKMFGADYCGTGRAFTIPGQSLQWRDEGNWMDYSASVLIEARWTAGGASCLQTPRVIENPTPESMAAFPDVIADIQSECGLPPQCSAVGSTDVYDMDGSHVVSANPL